LDVREAEILDVRAELLGELAVAEEPAVRGPPPGPEVHLVDRHRRMEPVAPRALGEPAGVAPLVPRRAGDDGGGGRTVLEPLPERIGLDPQRAGLAVADLVLIERARVEPRHEELPDAGPAAHGERVAAAVPAVELADHADPLGVRRPDGEPHAANAVAFVEMCAERAVRALVEAASEPLELGPVDQRRKAVRVVVLADLAAVVTPADAITGGQRRARPPPLKERASADALERRRG